MDLLEKLEFELAEAETKVRKATQEADRIRATIDSIKSVDDETFDALRTMSIMQGLKHLAMQKKGICAGVITTQEACHIFVQAQCFKDVRNAQTTISAHLSRSNYWTQISRGVWKFQPPTK